MVVKLVPHHLMHYVYVIKSIVDSSLYIGSTSDLRRRFTEHNKGLNISTKRKIPFVLVYYEAYRAKSDTVTRERKLKQFKNSSTELKKRIAESLTDA